MAARRWRRGGTRQSKIFRMPLLDRFVPRSDKAGPRRGFLFAALPGLCLLNLQLLQVLPKSGPHLAVLQGQFDGGL